MCVCASLCASMCSQTSIVSRSEKRCRLNAFPLINRYEKRIEMLSAGGEGVRMEHSVHKRIIIAVFKGEAGGQSFSHPHNDSTLV